MKIEDQNRPTRKKKIGHVVSKYGGYISEAEYSDDIITNTIKPIIKEFDRKSYDFKHKEEHITFKLFGWISFDIINNKNINAFAINILQDDFICIYYGLLEFSYTISHSLFTDPYFLPTIGNSNLETRVRSLKPYISINKNEYLNPTPRCTKRKLAANFFNQVILYFIYLHEFGHIKHCHTQYLKEFHSSGIYHEFMAANISPEESKIRITFEVQADAYAIRKNFVIWEILYDNSEVTQIMKPLEKLEGFIIVSLIALRILDPYRATNNSPQVTHPKYNIRKLNLYYACKTGNKEKKYIKESDYDYIFQNCVKTVDKIFQHMGFFGDSKQQYNSKANTILLDQFYKHSKELDNYLLKFQEKRDLNINAEYNKIIKEHKIV